LRGVRNEAERDRIIASIGDDVAIPYESETKSQEEDLTTLSTEELEQMEAELDATIERNAGEIERLKREELIRRLKAKRERVGAQREELGELQQEKGKAQDRGQAQPGD